MRKLRAQPITRLARFAVAYVIGQHDEVRRSIKRLAGVEQLACESAARELSAGTARPVHDQHGVGHHAAGVFFWRAERAVMDPQFGKRLAGIETEILDDIVPFAHRRQRTPRRLKRKRQKERKHGHHSPTFPETDSISFVGSKPTPCLNTVSILRTSEIVFDGSPSITTRSACLPIA